MTARHLLLVLCLLSSLALRTAQQQERGGRRGAPASSSCTPARPPSDALRPFCFVPSTVSQQAAEFLRTVHVQPQAALRNKPASEAARVRAEFDALTVPGSAAALAEYLQGVSNQTLSGVPVLFAVPKGARRDGRLLLYVHGGAYIKGACANLWQVVAPAAQMAGLHVACVDYRLAPQAPYPAGLNDVLDVYRVLLRERGFAGRSIGLVGDSAGGGMVLALLQRIAAEDLQLPGAVGLMAPWADLRKSGDTLTTLTAADPVLQYELNLAGAAEDYTAGDKSLLSNPLVSPLLAEYGNGRPFPPTLIQVGLRDSLLSTATLLYRKMLAGGLTAVTLSPWEGMWHVFQASLEVPEALEAQKEMAAHFARHLARQ